MATFFVKFQVAPISGSPQALLVEGAYALCWIVADSPVVASNKARFYVTKDDWEIKDDSDPVLEVTEKTYKEWDIFRESYSKAQEQGIALVYSGWSLDGKTTSGPMPLPQRRRFDLNSYVETQKKLAAKKRCLHFDRNDRCNKIIKAHSIQKNGHLSAIADKGHVYTITGNIGDIRKNDGRVTLQKRGIGKMSTFPGFCKIHDNKIFAPIDTQPLIPKSEQVLLYAYRSLCREFFVKENALDLVNAQLENWPVGHPFKIFEDLKIGTTLALENLKRHKASFDTSLKNQSFEDVEYTVFVSRKKPVLVFSGVIYPHFDFLGRQLQRLGNPSTELDLLTFSSATTIEGWAYIFAWHKTSAPACREFVGSLAQAIHNGKAGPDAMFRLVISNCENLALAPAWWEGLSDRKQVAIIDRINHGVDTFTPIEPDYLTKGLEGITAWEFENVFTNVVK